MLRTISEVFHFVLFETKTSRDVSGNGVSQGTDIHLLTFDTFVIKNNTSELT